MARKRTKIRIDKAGNIFLDVPIDGGSREMRVGFSRWYFDPPVGDDDSINIAAAAEQLQQDITGGTLQLQNLCENEDLRFPVEVELESRDDLEVLIRAIRRVFKEGLKRPIHHDDTKNKYSLMRPEKPNVGLQDLTPFSHSRLSSRNYRGNPEI